MRGSDEPHVYLSCFHRAEAPNFAFLEHPEKPGLGFEGQFSNFVKKQRASRGRLHQTPPGTARPGKGAFFVAKELGFDE